LVSDPRFGNGTLGMESERSGIAAAALACLGHLAMVLDHRGKILLFNQECERVTGYAAAEVEGSQLWDLVPETAQAGSLRSLFANLTPGLLPYRGESLLRSRRGDPRVISWTLTSVAVPGEREACVAAAGIDVSERRWAEADLLRTNQVLRTLIEASPLAISVVDRYGTVQVWSPAAQHLFGWSRREAAGRFAPCVPQESRDDFLASLRRTFAGENLSGAETVWCHKDGTEIDVEQWTAVLRSPHDEPESILFLVADIRSRKRAAEALRAGMQAVEAASHAKDHFLAVLSHELRTPLTPVLAAVSALEEDSSRFPGLRETLSMIRRNIELEARLIDDLLDLTRISRGKLEVHRQPVDAQHILVHAVNICCAQEVAAGRLRLEMGVAAGDYRMLADGPRMTQVFWNLLNNAVKFTPAGGMVRVRSRVETGPRGRSIAVEIADTGIGIEPEMLPRIFDAFEQVDRRITRRFGGLGLGLALSKAILELHGGTLTAESGGRGRGSTFTVRLPAGDPMVDLDETGLGLLDDWSAVGGAPERADRPLRILLVEDHADTAEAMADLLRGLDHQVTVAGSVTAGIAAAEAAVEEGGFDLLVSDLGLPDGSGHDLMRELGRRYSLKGIALSGYGMEEDVRKSLEAGFEKHLTKPVSLQILRTAIQQAAG
jgi:two-component system CheB/CheR fusion protein